MTSNKTELAKAILDTIPQIMDILRGEMRRQGAKSFTVPQFRVLTYLYRHGEASLSDLSRHQGVALPTMSKLVDGLVRQGLIVRRTDAKDRRRVAIYLSAEGRTAFNTIRYRTELKLATMVGHIGAPEREAIGKALETLREALLLVPAERPPEHES